MPILKGIGAIAAAMVLVVAMLVVFYVATTYIGVLANLGLLIPIAVVVVVVLTLVHLVRRPSSRATMAPEPRDKLLSRQAPKTDLDET